MSYKLFLDDERKPSDVTWLELPSGPWQIVRSYDAFAEYISEHGIPDVISFDHDLGVENVEVVARSHDIDYNKLTMKTGYHCATWLANYCLDNQVQLPTFYVHSMNPVGAQNIRVLLENFQKFQNSQ